MEINIRDNPTAQPDEYTPAVQSNMDTTPVLLVILDGFGCRKEMDGLRSTAGSSVPLVTDDRQLFKAARRKKATAGHVVLLSEMERST